MKDADAVAEARVLRRVIETLGPALFLTGSRLLDREDDPSAALAAAALGMPCVGSASRCAWSMAWPTSCGSQRRAARQRSCSRSRARCCSMPRRRSRATPSCPPCFAPSRRRWSRGGSRIWRSRRASWGSTALSSCRPASASPGRIRCGCPRRIEPARPRARPGAVLGRHPAARRTDALRERRRGRRPDPRDLPGGAARVRRSAEGVTTDSRKAWSASRSGQGRRCCRACRCASSRLDLASRGSSSAGGSSSRALRRRLGRWRAFSQGAAAARAGSAAAGGAAPHHHRDRAGEGPCRRAAPVRRVAERPALPARQARDRGGGRRQPRRVGGGGPIARRVLVVPSGGDGRGPAAARTEVPP